MYSKKEEFYNTLTHAIGIPLGFIGLLLLLYKDSQKTDYSEFSLWVYGSSFIFLYGASTAYHSVKAGLKPLLRKFDHIAIYFLIAGTYTPVSLIALESGNGWLLFWTVWSIAALGTVLKVFFTGKFEIVSLLLYLVMGWLIAFDFSSLSRVVTSDGILYLSLGGAAYTIGIIFYVVRKIPYHHAIWHLFVLAGSIFHFIFIYGYIV